MHTLPTSRRNMRSHHSSQAQINTSPYLSQPKTYTPTPNDYYDRILPTLRTVGEHAVIQAIIRHTYGWGNKEWDRISIAQLMGKTGLARSTVIRATKSLVAKGLIKKHTFGYIGEQE